MAKTIKPRPQNQQEILDQMLGNEAVDPTSDRPLVKPHNRGNDVSTKGDRIKDVSIGIVRTYIQIFVHHYFCIVWLENIKVCTDSNFVS